MKQAVEIENKHLFSKSDLKKLLIPLMIEQLLNSMMGMVDTVMVSNVGSAAISAVSLVDSINVLVIQLLSALAYRKNRDPDRDRCCSERYRCG